MDSETGMKQINWIHVHDESAFINSVTEHQDTLLSIAYSYLRNRQDSLEAIQEMTCRAWIKRRTLKNEKAFKSWIIRILIYVCIDEQRRRKRTIPQPDESMENNIPASWMISAQDNRIAMQSLLLKLQPKYRHVILLKYYNDMTLTDIASILGKPEGTIKTWQHKGLEQLRKLMKNRRDWHDH
ncbi:RNA polymerase, sigma subunit, SigV [Paenibacillus polysaccharolyticus]|uniref:RNA polymerase, sigma subunit, SigV n=1 Tax=Paenibacillus polysaccharolyticus TaxID=582692 RepID=A0A1G5B7H6_9BACL|nr:sigma-70 family RNA polymerase sigma factor [Paenibacillus polysaccharolyticus]SCX86075.1 RNA polymerase, sigma subunit, SigV [Paenibacillus polysaccharolyticus]